MKDNNPRSPNVPLLRALWSPLDGTWGLLKGRWGVLDKAGIPPDRCSGLVRNDLARLQEIWDALSLPSKLPKEPNIGGCQNYGPLLGPLNTRCRIILRTQKGAIILTTTQRT